ncbi:hypothetical protein BDV34DRAFT_196234 [Aspergillus parasiticus]|uniref:Uncharacterized protein n=1 Tax=Aspergillus parasiticus TaxID=5067 RepID=A0A5N6DJC8_ASPPA|nr:hypothetical protein BDV34DRAFT_196234 [Aspergillus parasiticus]
MFLSQLHVAGRSRYSRAGAVTCVWLSVFVHQLTLQHQTHYTIVPCNRRYIYNSNELAFSIPEVCRSYFIPTCSPNPEWSFIPRTMLVNHVYHTAIVNLMTTYHHTSEVRYHECLIEYSIPSRIESMASSHWLARFSRADPVRAAPVCAIYAMARPKCPRVATRSGIGHFCCASYQERIFYYMAK